MITENAKSNHFSYGDKTERIFRVLLTRKIKKLTRYRIAKEADVSNGYAYQFLKNLENEGLIKVSQILNPKGLFLKWAQRRDNRVFREYHIQNPIEVLKNAKMDYVMTGYFAENLIGHYLFTRYYEFYIKLEDASAWHLLLSSNGYVGKGNVRVMLADEHVFYDRDEIEGVPVVSIQQLIVDLYRTGAECAEAADLLVERAYP